MGAFAWVTLATNDSYSLGALVLAHSLKNAGTTHQLVVLVTPGVSAGMREQLTTVFNVIETVDVLDSKDDAHLALLKRPELGITFTKLHCWRLTQFEKCVFLDADTLIVRNCDELFERDEFSAAPDVGWPDCFNSGVFVFKPSDETYKQLIQFATEKGSFDGGDQGLLNSFFSTWATDDIKKHLPFVYNLSAVAFYSYLPAFKQYGSETRIMHFIGPVKPWLQAIDPSSRTVQPSSDSGHLQPMLQQWWDIFIDKVHPGLSKSLDCAIGMLPPTDTPACTHDPSSDTSFAPIDFTPAPSFPEPFTPYIEQDDCRQFNLPYQPFGIVSNDGELLNITFSDYARENEYGNEKSEFDDTETEPTKEPENHQDSQDSLPEPCDEQSMQEDQNDEPSHQQAQEEPYQFDYHTFVPDEACINAYLEQNMQEYQPSQHYQQTSYPCEASHFDEPESLPRFLTIPEDDARQSFNIHSDWQPPLHDTQVQHYHTHHEQHHTNISYHREPTPPPPQKEPLLVEPTVIERSKSSANLMFDVSDTSSFPAINSWKSLPEVNEVETPKKFTMPGLKPLKPRVRSPIIAKEMPRYTEFTEVHLASDYADPFAPPVDTLGFIEREILRKAKSQKLQIDLMLALQASPPIKTQSTKSHFNDVDLIENEYMDLSECRRQSGNLPKPLESKTSDEKLAVPEVARSDLRRRTKKVSKRSVEKWKPPENPPEVKNVDEILKRLSNLSVGYSSPSSKVKGIEQPRFEKYRHHVAEKLGTADKGLAAFEQNTSSVTGVKQSLKNSIAAIKKSDQLFRTFSSDISTLPYEPLRNGVAASTERFVTFDRFATVNPENTSSPKTKKNKKQLNKFGPVLFAEVPMNNVAEEVPEIVIFAATPIIENQAFEIVSKTTADDLNRTYSVEDCSVSSYPQQSKSDVNEQINLDNEVDLKRESVNDSQFQEDGSKKLETTYVSRPSYVDATTERDACNKNMKLEKLTTKVPIEEVRVLNNGQRDNAEEMSEIECGVRETKSNSTTNTVITQLDYDNDGLNAKCEGVNNGIVDEPQKCVSLDMNSISHGLANGTAPVPHVDDETQVKISDTLYKVLVEEDETKKIFVFGHSVTENTETNQQTVEGILSNEPCNEDNSKGITDVTVSQLLVECNKPMTAVAGDDSNCHESLAGKVAPISEGAHPKNEAEAKKTNGITSEDVESAILKIEHIDIVNSENERYGNRNGVEHNEGNESFNIKAIQDSATPLEFELSENDLARLRQLGLKNLLEDDVSVSKEVMDRIDMTSTNSEDPKSRTYANIAKSGSSVATTMTTSLPSATHFPLKPSAKPQKIGFKAKRTNFRKRFAPHTAEKPAQASTSNVVLPTTPKQSKRKADKVETELPSNRYELLEEESPMRIVQQSKKLKKLPQSSPRAQSSLTTSSPLVNDAVISVANPVVPEPDDNSGIAGAIAQLSLDPQSPATAADSSAAQTDYLRRQNWETGNMDYMGRDSFANIWTKISETIGDPNLPEDDLDPSNPELEQLRPVSLAMILNPSPNDIDSIETLPCDLTTSPGEAAEDDVIFERSSEQNIILPGILEEIEEAEEEPPSLCDGTLAEGLLSDLNTSTIVKKDIDDIEGFEKVLSAIKDQTTEFVLDSLLKKDEPILAFPPEHISNSEICLDSLIQNVSIEINEVKTAGLVGLEEIDDKMSSISKISPNDSSEVHSVQSVENNDRYKVHDRIEEFRVPENIAVIDESISPRDISGTIADIISSPTKVGDYISSVERASVVEAAPSAIAEDDAHTDQIDGGSPLFDQATTTDITDRVPTLSSFSAFSDLDPIVCEAIDALDQVLIDPVERLEKLIADEAMGSSEAVPATVDENTEDVMESIASLNSVKETIGIEACEETFLDKALELKLDLEVLLPSLETKIDPSIPQSETIGLSGENGGSADAIDKAADALEELFVSAQSPISSEQVGDYLSVKTDIEADIETVLDEALELKLDLEVLLPSSEAKIDSGSADVIDKAADALDELFVTAQPPIISEQVGNFLSKITDTEADIELVSDKALDMEPDLTVFSPSPADAIDPSIQQSETYSSDHYDATIAAIEQAAGSLQELCSSVLPPLSSELVGNMLSEQTVSILTADEPTDDNLSLASDNEDSKSVPVLLEKLLHDSKSTSKRELSPVVANVTEYASEPDTIAIEKSSKQLGDIIADIERMTYAANFSEVEAEHLVANIEHSTEKTSIPPEAEIDFSAEITSMVVATRVMTPELVTDTDYSLENRTLQSVLLNTTEIDGEEQSDIAVVPNETTLGPSLSGLTQVRDVQLLEPTVDESAVIDVLDNLQNLSESAKREEDSLYVAEITTESSIVIDDKFDDSVKLPAASSEVSDDGKADSDNQQDQSVTVSADVINELALSEEAEVPIIAPLKIDGQGVSQEKSILSDVGGSAGNIEPIVSEFTPRVDSSKVDPPKPTDTSTISSRPTSFGADNSSAFVAYKTVGKEKNGRESHARRQSSVDDSKEKKGMITKILEFVGVVKKKDATDTPSSVFYDDDTSDYLPRGIPHDESVDRAKTTWKESTMTSEATKRSPSPRVLSLNTAPTTNIITPTPPVSPEHKQTKPDAKSLVVDSTVLETPPVVEKKTSIFNETEIDEKPVFGSRLSESFGGERSSPYFGVGLVKAESSEIGDLSFGTPPTEPYITNITSVTPSDEIERHETSRAVLQNESSGSNALDEQHSIDIVFPEFKSSGNFDFSDPEAESESIETTIPFGVITTSVRSENYSERPTIDRGQSQSLEAGALECAADQLAENDVVLEAVTTKLVISQPQGMDHTANAIEVITKVTEEIVDDLAKEKPRVSFLEGDNLEEILNPSPSPSKRVTIDESIDSKLSEYDDSEEIQSSILTSDLSDSVKGDGLIDRDEVMNDLDNIIAKAKLIAEDQMDTGPDTSFSNIAKSVVTEEPVAISTDFEELKVTSNEDRKRTKEKPTTSKLSDQILKAIPPPRRKPISDAKRLEGQNIEVVLEKSLNIAAVETGDDVIQEPTDSVTPPVPPRRRNRSKQRGEPQPPPKRKPKK